MRRAHHSILYLLSSILFCSSAFAAAPASTTAPSDPWSLVWSDEFTGPKVDPAKWNVEDWASTRNQELQYYAPDDVSIVDGCLRLTSRKRDYQSNAYTSGAVNSKGKFSQTYGRFEVRARLPKTRGLWPAHWLLPQDGTWPPEIDIMELLGHEPNKVYMTTHWGIPRRHEQSGGNFTGPDFSADFHTFAVEWAPGLVRWLIDGEERFRSNVGVPEKPFYILLNTAVGGTWPGNPDQTSVFPQFHDIDYVRIYRREKDRVPASVQLIGLDNNERVAPGDVGLTAAVANSDPASARVEYFADSTKLGDSTTVPYGFVWQDVQPGVYVVTARISDKFNSSVTSLPARIVVGRGAAVRQPGR